MTGRRIARFLWSRDPDHVGDAERTHPVRVRSAVSGRRGCSPEVPQCRLDLAGSDRRSSTHCALKSAADRSGCTRVNYPASSDFGSGIQFAETVIEGIRDAGAHVQDTAANCPNTRIVLGVDLAQVLRLAPAAPVDHGR